MGSKLGQDLFVLTLTQPFGAGVQGSRVLIRSFWVPGSGALGFRVCMDVGVAEPKIIISRGNNDHNGLEALI